MSDFAAVNEVYATYFKDRYNLLFIDLMGHGYSIKSDNLSKYTIGHLSEDLFNILKKENVKRINIIGHSFGNFVSLEFIREHKKMINSVVFISAGHRLTKNKRYRYFKFFISPLFIKLIPHKTEKGRQINYSKYINTGDFNVRRTIADVSNTGLKCYLIYLRDIFNLKHSMILENITFPTLFIHGARDKMFPVEDAIKMSKLVKNSKLIILNNADHILVLNNYHELSKEIEDFLSSF